MPSEESISAEVRAQNATVVWMYPRNFQKPKDKGRRIAMESLRLLLQNTANDRLPLLYRSTILQDKSKLSRQKEGLIT
jgi:hypothetical protein